MRTPRAVLVGLILCLAAGGCYQRVVHSRGLGSPRAQQGYRSDTAADRWLDEALTPEPTTRTRSRWVEPGATTQVRQQTAEEWRRSPR
jgi:hypothetical protein